VLAASFSAFEVKQTFRLVELGWRSGTAGTSIGSPLCGRLPTDDASEEAKLMTLSARAAYADGSYWHFSTNSAGPLFGRS
jgi:hypothetical protein